MFEDQSTTADFESPPRSRVSARLLLLVTVLIVLGSALVLVKMRPPQVPDHPSVGQTLTALQLEPLTAGSRAVTLPELKGKVILVNFWGPWCQYCLLEFPELVALQKEYSGEQDFEMLLVSCSAQVNGDRRSLKRDTERFLESREFNLSIYSDPLARNRLMLEAQGIRPFGYPTTLILDRQGVIRGLWMGYAKENAGQMRALLRRLTRNSGA